MYAIVDIAGQQFKVEKDQKLYVHRLDAKEGSKVTFDKVLLVDDSGKVKVGSPLVDNTIVSAKVLSHLKGDKVLVFKKKRRKGYKKLNGHRQYLTELVIESIGAGKAPAKKAADKATEAKAETKAAPAKPAAKKPAVKKEAAPKATEAKPEAAVKKPAAAKKPAAPKAEAKKAAPKKEAAPKAEAKKAAPKKEDDKAE
ncbi:MAG TPA: 50S ribosomal protein L21 [Bacteroidales bacterium]|jgi:large subunit ribosomal protein L21|nr:50S ribosomal protein L21 [Bacteroidales bacterium]